MSYKSDEDRLLLQLATFASLANWVCGIFGREKTSPVANEANANWEIVVNLKPSRDENNIPVTFR